MPPRALSDGDDAIISDDEVYRYVLQRRLGFAEIPRHLLWIMLNPSTANALKDDPTIRKCKGFASLWGKQDGKAFTMMRVVNLFALRSPRPWSIKKAIIDGLDPVGPENTAYIDENVLWADEIIVAWGAHGDIRFRGEKRSTTVLKQIDDGDGKIPKALGYTKNGQPNHPLMLPYTAQRKTILT